MTRADAAAFQLSKGRVVGERDRLTLGRRGVALLSEVPLFAGLSHRHLRKIARVAQEVRVPPMRMILQAGSQGDAFYVIAEGAVKVYRGVVPAGRPIATLRDGEFFGELALLDGGPRSASVVSDTDVVAIRLSRASFRKLLLKEPTIAVRILEAMAQRIRARAESATD